MIYEGLALQMDQKVRALTHTDLAKQLKMFKELKSKGVKDELWLSILESERWRRDQMPA